MASVEMYSFLCNCTVCSEILWWLVDTQTQMVVWIMTERPVPTKSIIILINIRDDFIYAKKFFNTYLQQD